MSAQIVTKPLRTGLHLNATNQMGNLRSNTKHLPLAVRRQKQHGREQVQSVSSPPVLQPLNGSWHSADPHWPALPLPPQLPWLGADSLPCPHLHLVAADSLTCLLCGHRCKHPETSRLVCNETSREQTRCIKQAPEHTFQIHWSCVVQCFYRLSLGVCMHTCE